MVLGFFEAVSFTLTQNSCANYSSFLNVQWKLAIKEKIFGLPSKIFLLWEKWSLTNKHYMVQVFFKEVDIWSFNLLAFLVHSILEMWLLTSWGNSFWSQVIKQDEIFHQAVVSRLLCTNFNSSTEVSFSET